MTKRRHVRDGDLDPDVLRAGAQRYHAIYGEYGPLGGRGPRHDC